MSPVTAVSSNFISRRFPASFFTTTSLARWIRLSKRYKLAVVSNIDDDLLALTPLRREFDLVCTAQRARGYKPDGTLFRYLIEHAPCTRDRSCTPDNRNSPTSSAASRWD